jgi:hypothetical protein
MTHPKPMDLYTIRLQALNWLFSAIRPWLLQDEGRIRDFPQGSDVEWTSVGNLAYFHNLEPLLFWVLSTRDGETDVPVWLKQRWEQAYFGTFLKNEEHLGVLEVLLERCKTEGVSVIVLKGPALIGRIYRDPALRPMADLDILCAKRDLGRMTDMARELGYEASTVGDDPASTQHVSMHHVNTPFLLEFHFRPYETIRNHGVFMERAWNEMEWIEVKNIPCPVLSLEMELAFDLAHLAHHQFDVSLKHLIDIAGLLVFCRGQLNWNKANARLREFRLERVLDLSTGFVSRMMHLPLSSHIPRSKRENKAHKEWDASLRDLLALLDQARLMDIKGVVWDFRVAIRNRRGLREKFVFIKNRIFPFLDATANQYGIASGSDIFLYYLRRILFYLQRLLLTLTHFSKPFRASDPDSLAAKRADAKNRLTRELYRPETMAHRGK